MDFNVEKNQKDPECKVSDNVRIWKYKDIFAKGCTPIDPDKSLR